jgi:hypothetical protein
MATIGGANLGTKYYQYLNRVLSDGGQFVKPDANEIQSQIQTILDYNPSIFIFPTPQKIDKNYSIIPNSASGDFTFTRSSSGSYFDKNLILQTGQPNQPRLYFDTGSGDFEGLLIERNLSNLILRSEEFENAYWPKFSSTITTSSAIAPDGMMTADKITITSNLNDAVLIRKSFTQNTTIQVGKTYTFSIWMKSDEPINIRLDINDSPTVLHAVDTEWKRYSVTRVNTNQYQFGDFIDIATVADQLNKYVYVWGAQLEEGPSMTSYVKTTDTQITRQVDTLSSPLLNFNTTQWSVFFEIKYLNNYLADNGDVYASPLIWYFRRLGTTSVNFWNQNAQQNLGSFSFTANSVKRFKAMMCFNGSTISTYINGTKTGNQIVPTNLSPYQNFLNSNTYKIATSKLDLGLGRDQPHVLKFLCVFPNSFTDSEALKLTTL